MPLTAYSISQRKELDVEQLLAQLSARDGVPVPASSEQIPDSWRDHMRTDIECPCCFVQGAEIVRGSSSRTTQWSRQAFFRFVKPGHNALCDFAGGDTSGINPETAIAFGTAKSALTRAVRDLVGAGIHLGLFDQQTIRDMREWFFGKKREATFLVTLDPRTPKWVAQLGRAYFATGLLPDGVELTSAIASMPGFDWRAEATRVLVERHRATADFIHQNRLWRWSEADRIESLAKRHQGQRTFNPSVLKNEYDLSWKLSQFLAHNHVWGSASATRDAKDTPTHLVAFSALLLFVNNWETAGAIGDFIKITAAVGQADPSLGNVIGLNPFHDYRAWETLQALQEANLTLSLEVNPKEELAAIEAQLRARFAA